MPKSTKGLTAQQQQAAALTAQGCRGIDIAQQIGVAPETVSRWRSRSDFTAEVNNLLAESRAATEHRLQGMAADAADAVADVLADRKASPGDRLKAAQIIFEMIGMERLRPGPSDPRDIEQQAERQALDRKLARQATEREAEHADLFGHMLV